MIIQAAPEIINDMNEATTSSANAANLSKLLLKFIEKFTFRKLRLSHCKNTNEINQVIPSLITSFKAKLWLIFINFGNVFMPCQQNGLRTSF
mmetsp:Transcript_16528/g.19792  ORF Transcript_16528/g.19792 Transcript_16528/m.19792 type:complete len:92 (+) Transcript_16528:560-835(+)